MKRFSLFTAVALVVAALAPSVEAEVCALMSPDGTAFVRTDVLAVPSRGLIWTKITGRADNLCLNLDGDYRGDQGPTHGVLLMPKFPVIQVDARQDSVARTIPRSPRRGDDPEQTPEETIPVPLVVWPRHDGNDWELVFSKWDFEAKTWSRSLFTEMFDNDSDDIDPILAVIDNRPVLTWNRVYRGEIRFMRMEGELVHLGNWYDIEWRLPEVLPPATTIGLGGDTHGQTTGGPWTPTGDTTGQ